MKWWKVTVLAVGKSAALAVAAVGAYRLARIASIGAAYKAKILCSGIFVAHRDPSSILDGELSVDKFRILRHIKTTVDFNTRKVTASVFGIVKRTARFTPGFGSSLVYPTTPPIDSPAPGLTNLQKEQMDMEDRSDPRLDHALEWAFSEPDSARTRRTRAVVILHDGNIVAERYAAGFGKDTPLAGWSMAKAVTNALAGIMVREGKLRLDAPVAAPEAKKRRPSQPDHPRTPAAHEQRPSFS